MYEIGFCLSTLLRDAAFGGKMGVGSFMGDVCVRRVKFETLS